MLRELAEVVEIMAKDVSLVLWLEDLRWNNLLDGGLASLSGKAPGAGARSCPWLVPTGRGTGWGNPLEAAKDNLKMHGHCREVALQRLDETAVGEYLASRFPATAALGGPGSVVHRRTGGNPLFMSSTSRTTS